MTLVYKTVKNHTDKVQASVLKLKTNVELCDATIKCGDFEVRAHKVVLASSTEYFRAMFLNDTMKARMGIVDFSAINSEVVKQCIDFIYSGTVGISMDIARGLLEASEMMQLTKLSESCVEFLTENIDLQSCAEVLGLIRLYGKDSHTLPMKSFITAHFEEYRKTADFLLLDYGCLVQCLEFIEQGNTRLEMQKWFGILSWTNRSRDRQEHFKDLFKTLDLHCLSRKFMSENICCEESVKASVECLQLIQDVLLSDRFHL